MLCLFGGKGVNSGHRPLVKPCSLFQILISIGSLPPQCTLAWQGLKERLGIGWPDSKLELRWLQSGPGPAPRSPCVPWVTRWAADTRVTSEPLDGPEGVVPRLGDAGARDAGAVDRDLPQSEWPHSHRRRRRWRGSVRRWWHLGRPRARLGVSRPPGRPGPNPMLLHWACPPRPRLESALPTGWRQHQARNGGEDVGGWGASPYKREAHSLEGGHREVGTSGGIVDLGLTSLREELWVNEFERVFVHQACGALLQ